ncbi:MAG: hypothetical protein KGL48_08260 [Sphingomonadales bacterium]|nr:hypothetical protein [Sphingomonadales bacterium]MDE2568875.1 hypothetical protein [Sphingomonadales bacterium]
MKGICVQLAALSLGAGGLLAAGAALAHDDPNRPDDGSQVGTRFKQKPKVTDEARQRLQTNYIALCVQKSVPDRVDWFLRHSDDKEYVKPDGSHSIGTYLVIDQCLGDTMNGMTLESTFFMSTSSIRGLLSEQAYLAGRPAYLAAPEGAVIPARTFVATGDELPVARGLAQFEDCVATTDPANADALLRTKPGTAEENAAARALVPALGACLAKGQTLSFTAQSIRSFAAEGMWQRFVAPAAPSYTGQP